MERVLAIVAVAFPVLGVPATIPVIRSAWLRGDYLTATLAFAMCLGLVGLLFVIRPRRPPAKLRDTEVFQTLGELSDDARWNRPDLLDDVHNQIASGGIVVVVGPSGAGKSVMLRDLLPLRVGELVYCSDRTQWPDPRTAAGKIVVLDQFEHALIPAGSVVQGQQWQLSHIRSDVASLASSARAVILAVRDDWYIKLAFMRDLIPPLDATNILSQPGTDVEQDVVNAFERRVLRIRAETEIPPIPPTATPMALQACGQLFELAQHEVDRDSDPNRLPDIETAVEQLVEKIALRAPHRSAALKALHALSCARERSDSLSRGEIVTATGDRDREVMASIEYFRASGLAVRDGGRYELTHDALMTGVERLTAVYLDPTERDNIRVSVKSVPESPQVIQPRRLFPWLVWLAMLAIAATRALLPDDGLWYALSQLTPPNTNGVVEPLYFAVGIPHLAWSYYVIRHHSRIYRAGDRTRSQCIFSYVSTALLIVWLLIGVFAIEWWIVAIALGGLVQAAKSFSYALDTSRPESVRRLWRDGALRSLGNVSVVLFLGLLFALTLPKAHISQAELIRFFYFGSVPLTYAALYLYWVHVSSASAARSRSLLARRAT